MTAARLRLLVVAGTVAIALLIPFFVGSFRVYQFTLVLAYAVAVLGLNLLVGYNGQISLGHGAFFALGAYTAALLIEKASVPYLLSVPAAGIVSFAAGFLFGVPALRLRGLYLALVTLSLAIATPALIKRSEGLTEGTQGLTVERPTAPDWLPLADDQFVYLLTFAVTAVMFLLAWNLVRGQTGRAIVAVRDNEIPAKTMGINLAQVKTRVFAVSAAYAGVAGALYVFSIGFVAPEAFTVTLSLGLLAALVVGGVASIGGAVFGALFIEFVPVYAADVDEALTGVIYGAVLILFMFVLPGGVAGIGRKLRDRLITEDEQTSKRRGKGQMKAKTTAFMVLAAVLALLAAGCGRDDEEGGGGSDPGITDKEIKLGGSYPFSGPASAYRSIGDGAKAYFDSVNAKGGVDGRKINFIALNDAYEPPRAVTNARRLIEQEKVFALFNTLGTPNNTAIWDYVNKQKVPHLFVATGASTWGSDVKGHPYTTGWQPDYQTEGKVYADYLKQEKPNAKVAALYQNDAFGKDLLAGFEKAIEGGDAKVVAKESYEVTDPSVSSQMSKLADSGADTFINITTPKFSAQAIATAAKIGWKPLHILNNVGASKALVLKPAGLKASQGIISTAYFKDPEDPQWADDAAMKEYKAGLKKYAPRSDPLDPFHVYGWAVAATMVEALKGMKEPTRESLMESARSIDTKIPILLPGIDVKMDGEQNGYPIEAMQIQRFEGENWKLQGEVIQAPH